MAQQPPLPQPGQWHQMSREEVLARLDTDPDLGLSAAEAAKRRRQYGPNQLPTRRGEPLWRLFLLQFVDFMVLVLLGATAVSALMGEVVDALTITGIVLLNGIIGFIQEYRAERALAALQEMAAPQATVVRGGLTQRIPASELVPGDLVLLEPGYRVPADLRLIWTQELAVEESAFTGESVPVAKHTDPLPAERVPVAERRNMAFMSTTVTQGRARGVVAGTGLHTEIGQIADLLASVRGGQTPLQARLEHLARYIVAFFGLVCLAVLFLGIDHGEPFRSTFLTSVSLAVAAIPEGLPAIVTIALALGVQRMSRRRAVVRKLPAVETLGSTTFICSDKTGTLTQNAMTVTEIHLVGSGRRIDVSGRGWQIQGEFTCGGRPLAPYDEGDLRRLLEVGALCNNAVLPLPTSGGAAGKRGGAHSGGRRDREGSRTPWPGLPLARRAGAGGSQAVAGNRRSQTGGARVAAPVGDPTEIALLVAAAKAGIYRDDLEEEWPRAAEFAFDSRRKRMSTYHWRSAARPAAAPPTGPTGLLAVKGAAELLLPLCRSYLYHGREQILDASVRAGVEQVVEDMTRRALRVLAVAYRRSTVPPLPPGADGKDRSGAVAGPSCQGPASLASPRDGRTSAEAWERDLVLVGVVGLYDPPRPEVREAIQVAAHAGIRTLMLTGDHLQTALSVARELGLLEEGFSVSGQAMSGADLDRLSDEALLLRLDRLRVCARVSPEHKLRLVRLLKQRGEVVAMTGDGVNDAPAIKEASIGVAMGISGTDVAKEAADMVLMDDNYATIVAAVEEGRTTYDNIRKSIRYLLSCNVGEVLTMLFASIWALPSPMLALQLLWMNLVTDGLPAIALSLDPPAGDVMRRPPRPPREGIFARGMLVSILIQGAVMGFSALAAFIAAFTLWHDLPAARTIAFTTLVLAQLVFVFRCREESLALKWRSLVSNPRLLGAILISVAMQLVVLYAEPLRPVFDTVSLNRDHWLLVAASTLAAGLLTEAGRLVHTALRWGAHKALPAGPGGGWRWKQENPVSSENNG
ncbi:MAG: cation-translocating P-type ATPase [Firmicutes bacterium]|nr:cation-translocating P-type ATPase [Bacillota bacterium]